MSRTTSQAVKSVLLGDYDGESSLVSFIDTASVVVTRVNTCAVAKGVTLSTAELELIERWLAAHFYACSDQPYSVAETDKARGRFQGQTGMFLTGTKYGQTAMRLDPSGCLEAIGNRTRAKATVNWLGFPPSEQTDYVDRD